MELMLPPRPSGLPDESVASLVERHFGVETVERLADPLLSGIFGGDSAQLSARTVLPRLVEMESEYGSLTRGMLAAHRAMRARVAAGKKANTGGGGNARPAVRGVFSTLRGGMQQLVDALTARLDPTRVRCATPVTGLEKVEAGWKVQAGGKEEFYEAVIMTSPAWAAGELLGKVDAVLGEELSAIPYSSSITVNLIYDRAEAGAAAEGIRISGSGRRRTRDAGLHVCSSQVFGQDTGTQGGAEGFSRRDEKRGAGWLRRTRRW